MTQREVAALLGVKESTLESWRTSARRQPLGYVRLGKLIRYDPDEVQRFIEAAREAPAAVEARP